MTRGLFQPRSPWARPPWILARFPSPVGRGVQIYSPGDAVSQLPFPALLLQEIAFLVNYTAGERPLRLSIPCDEELPDLLFLSRGDFLPKRPGLFGFPDAEAPFAKFNYPRCKADLMSALRSAGSAASRWAFSTFVVRLKSPLLSISFVLCVGI